MKKLTEKQVKIVAHLIDCEIGMMNELEYKTKPNCDYCNTYAYKMGYHSLIISDLTDLLINGYDDCFDFETLIKMLSSVYLEGVKI